MVAERWRCNPVTLLQPDQRGGPANVTLGGVRDARCLLGRVLAYGR